jgi:hypothetical protein
VLSLAVLFAAVMLAVVTGEVIGRSVALPQQSF